MKHFICMILAMVLALGLMACGADPAPATNSSTTIPTETKSTPSKSMNDIVAFVQQTLEDSYDNVTVSFEETTVVIDIVFSGLASSVQDVITVQSPELVNAWNQVIDSQTNLCGTVLNLIEASGYDDVDVLLNVRNDLNTENCLLIIFNKSVIYDVVNSK